MLFNQSFPISNTTPFISPNKKPLPSIVLSKKDANTYTSPRGNDASTNTETLGEKLGDRNLNFDKDRFPPQKAIYISLLKETGLHFLLFYFSLFPFS